MDPNTTGILAAHTGDNNLVDSQLFHQSLRPDGVLLLSVDPDMPYYHLHSSLILILIEPGQKPRKAEIDGNLKGMQQVVGGYVRAIYPFEDPVALVCHKMAKLLSHPLNRVLRDGEGDIYEIIAGTFFRCGAPLERECFENLNDGLMEKYRKQFCCPEMFFIQQHDCLLANNFCMIG